MNPSLFLHSNNKFIGVVRNPYERIIAAYVDGLYWIGLSAWIDEIKPLSQVETYKGADYIITLENWEQDLHHQKIVVNDPSPLPTTRRVSNYQRWYSKELLKQVNPIVQPDLDRWGYSF